MQKPHLFAAVLMSLSPLAAHDMWIEPATFSPQAGQIVSVRLRVGQDMLGDPLPRMSQLINQFVIEDSTGRNQLVGREGSDPAGFWRVANPGVQIIGYHSHPSSVELTAEKFNQYLKEEGLDAVAALRARRNQSGVPVKEIFSRCAKSLVLSGPMGTAGDRVLGFPLELVSEKNPYGMRPGDEIPVRLTYENKPLAGALVIAMNRLNPSEKVTARTDSNGRVKLRLPAGGMWMVKAVHMIPAPAASKADWASFWASLTFELRTPASVSRN